MTSSHVSCLLWLAHCFTQVHKITQQRHAQTLCLDVTYKAMFSVHVRGGPSIIRWPCLCCVPSSLPFLLLFSLLFQYRGNKSFSVCPLCTVCLESVMIGILHSVLMTKYSVVLLYLILTQMFSSQLAIGL